MRFILALFLVGSAYGFEIVGPMVQFHEHAAHKATVTWLTQVGNNIPTFTTTNAQVRHTRNAEFGDLVYYITQVHLDELPTGKRCDFQLAVGDIKRAYSFRVPPMDQPDNISFVIGGDMGPGDQARSLLIEAKKLNPDFAVIGGDISYAHGNIGQAQPKVWVMWLNLWAETMTSEQGEITPLLVAIGNHEVDGGYRRSKEEAKYFYQLFHFPDNEAYYVADIGDYLSFIMLDTWHISHPKDQVEFLKGALIREKDVPYLIPVYHFPAYGILKGGYDAWQAKTIRKYWTPLFEDSQVRVIFENDHHIYKRSKPIYQDKVNKEKGIYYLGDGAWGRLRPLKKEQWESLWYVENAAPLLHFMHVVITKEKPLSVKVIDPQGTVYESIQIELKK